MERTKERHPLMPDGATQIASEEFHGTVGQLDVMPTPVGRYDDEWGYLSRWTLRDGKLVGLSAGGTHLRPRTHYLPPGVR